jgi:hypothetical protein
MELVWGPELSFQESSSEVYKFLGSEKYTSVLNSIYAGLGVPPTLTGMANNGGGFTNNFISLKTLVERLQYGRDRLVKFWEKELEIVRKAMGFRYKAHIQFDQMTLSDEAAEKNLLIQLADRDIISHETLLERFKEIPQIENIRIKRELSKRDTVGPEKAGPFHPPPPPEKPEPNPAKDEPAPDDKTTDIEVQGGRPLFKQDDGPRKKRVEKPRSKPSVAECFVYAEESWSKISEVVTKAFLEVNQKKNMRQLTKAQFADLEKLKLDIFTNFDIGDDVSEASIYKSLKNNVKAPQKFTKDLESKNVNIESMNIDTYRKYVIGSYIDHKMHD